MPLASKPAPIEVFIDIPALYPAQQYVRDHAARNTVLAWGRRAGKTTFGTDLVVETVIDQGAPLGWFAPDFKILDPVWNYYVKLFAPITIDKDETKRYLELRTGGIFECWSMQSGVVARSRQYRRVVVDEAAHIDNFKNRFEYEIGATLLDQVGDAWLFSSTNGNNDFKYYYDLGLDPSELDWASFHLPTWKNPFIPFKERERVRKKAEEEQDPVARQEYGAEFLDGNENFVPAAWVDACGQGNEWWEPLDPYTPVCGGIDVGLKNDCFAITGWGRSQAVYDANGNLLKGRKYKPAFSRIFHPEELTTGGGIVSFDKPKEYLRQVSRDFHILEFAYDPHQAQGMADDLRAEGLPQFVEYPQGVKRTLGDSLLYTLIRDREIEWHLYDEDHKEMAQHIKNANTKIEGEDKRRLVKRNDNLKIDGAVGTSMAIYALQSYYV
jgi:hypothetical protein